MLVTKSAEGIIVALELQDMPEATSAYRAAHRQYGEDSPLVRHLREVSNLAIAQMIHIDHTHEADAQSAVTAWEVQRHLESEADAQDVVLALEAQLQADRPEFALEAMYMLWSAKLITDQQSRQYFDQLSQELPKHKPSTKSRQLARQFGKTTKALVRKATGVIPAQRGENQALYDSAWFFEQVA